MPDRSRYRLVNYIGARILQARELLFQQDMNNNEDPTVTGTYSASAYGLGALYREGASLNVTATPSGTTVTLSATDNTKPMLIFVRGKWEKLKTAEAPAAALGAAGTQVFLNWALQKTTSVDDAQLIDASSSEATAEMGELILSVSPTDTSGVALAGNQYEKNTAPIVLFQYTNSGTALTSVPLSNVLPQGRASNTTEGLVKLTTSTASGVAVSTDDPRLSDTRSPAVGSVVNVSVRTPVAVGGNNADGTPTYNLTTDAGGISATKIIINATTQLLEDGWAWLKGQVASLLSNFNAHATAKLGLGNTHPMPSATDVGAAPLSHVGSTLGLSTSHPLGVSQDKGGFTITRNPAVTPLPNDYGFGIIEGGTTKAGFSHDGDAFSLLANAFNVGATDGDGARAHSGTLGKLSLLAAIVSDHVNKTSHNNPHGLAAGDIGAAATSYVDAGDASVTATALGYADLVSSITVRKVVSVAPTIVSVWPAGVGPGEPNIRINTLRYFNWAIITIGNKFEIGFGMGQLNNAETIPLPPSDANGTWTTLNAVAGGGMAINLDKNDLNSPSWADATAYVNQISDGNGGIQPGTPIGQWASSFGLYGLQVSVNCVAWRFITQPPVLISLSPSPAAVGATLTITGRNFGSVPANATVTINGAAATPVTCNPTVITVLVPAGATVGAGSVSVTVSARASLNSLPFTRS